MQEKYIMSGYHKNEVYALLNDKGIPYEAVEHEAVFTMEEMERAGIDAHGCICKNLFLRDAKGRQHYLVTVPASTSSKKTVQYLRQ